MKLIESIIQEVEVNIPPTVYVKSDAFANMWTRNDTHRRVSNPELILQVRDAWQKKVGGQIEIQDERVLIDTRYMEQIDPISKQVNKLDKNDLLNMDVNQLVINRAIITLYAKGLHPNFFPTLVIVLTENGEKYCFGETVEVCNNFTVFNSSYFFDTTTRIKKGKYTTQDAVDFFKAHIFEKTQEVFEIDFEEIENMKARKISRKDFLSFMGEQHQQIEYVNHARNNKTIGKLSEDFKNLALNSRQLAKIAIEAKAPSHSEYEWQADETNQWNVLNYGTEILKAERGTDMATLLESHTRWGELIKNYPFEFKN